MTCEQTITIDCEKDFGDAPAGYPTEEADDGARHIVGSGLTLGSIVDADSDGVTTPDAEGDDGDGTDDEDGVTFTVLIPGEDATITATVTGDGGVLQGWVDFNGDGDWDDPGEQILTDEAVVDGVNVFMISVPADAVVGDTGVRFRLSTESGLEPTGLAPNGEVEDYIASIRTATAGVVAQVICDHTDNGQLDDSEFGIAGLTVQLINAATQVVDSAVTDGDGLVAFDVPPLGDYTIRVVDGVGTVVEGKAVATNYVNPASITVDDPQGAYEADFGYISTMAPAYAIDGFVFQDINNNQFMDENMTGAAVEGIQILLLQNNVEIDSTFSNQDGYYVFPDLTPGSYKLAVNVNGVIQILEAYAISNLTDGEGNSATGAVVKLGEDTTTMVNVELVQNCMGERVDFGFILQPTAVTMGEITAVAVSSGIEVQWETGVEIQNLGFYVYRSDSVNGEKVLIGDFVVADGSESFYSLLDANPLSGPAYYWVEDIDWDINRTMNGPALVE